jgi:hypothetical protein
VPCHADPAALPGEIDDDGVAITWSPIDLAIDRRERPTGDRGSRHPRVAATGGSEPTQWVGVEQVPDGRGVGGRPCLTRDAVSRYRQVAPLNFIRWIPSFGSDRRSLSKSRHTSELVRTQLAPGPPSGGALDVIQVRGCVTI